MTKRETGERRNSTCEECGAQGVYVCKFGGMWKCHACLNPHETPRIIEDYMDYRSAIADAATWLP